MIPAELGVNWPPQILAEFEAKPAPSAQFSDLLPDLIRIPATSLLTFTSKNQDRLYIKLKS